MSEDDTMPEGQEPRNESAAHPLNDRIQTSGAALLQWLRDTTPIVVTFARRNGVALVAGLLGSLAAVILTITFRLTWGSPTLPELVGERILPTMKAADFVGFLVRFSPNSKTGPLGLALLGQFVLGILIGPAYALVAQAFVPKTASQRWPDRRELIVAGSFVLAMEVVGIALFWPVLGEGLLGYSIGTSRWLTILAMLLTFSGFVGVTMLANHSLSRAWGRWTEPEAAGVAVATTPTDGAIARRDALRAVGAVIVAAALSTFAIDRLIIGYLGRSNLAYEGMNTPIFDVDPITKLEDFYIVSKNALDPEVILANWHLEVGGLVDHTQSWTYDELKSLPSETRAVTLECISNQVYGHLISTANWTGVTLKTVLDHVGVPAPAGKRVAFYSVDGYSTSLPLDEVLAARALLVWNMNGVPLPNRHGYPLRVIMPGRYGEQNPKWLSRIEIIDYHYKGFYESQGWNVGQVSTISRFNFPLPGKVVLDPKGDNVVRGIAYAGIRGITRVEVSADAGLTWSDATLTPPLSDQSWVFWRWQPLVPGRYTLMTRATDGTGTVQPMTQRGTVPDGATGWGIASVAVTTTQ